MQAPTRSTELVGDREIVMVRELDVPARLVFKAFTRPEYLKRWFGPGDYPVTMCEMDFRVGGTYRMAMTGPDGAQGPIFGGSYLAIEQDKLISWDDGWEKDGGKPFLVVTVTLDEHPSGQKTRMTVHSRFDTAARRDEHLKMGFDQGFNLSLDQLGSLAASFKE